MTERIWNVKAIDLDGNLLKVKAVNAEGKIFPVKAIQYTSQHILLDIKAFVNGGRIPVKLISKDDGLPYLMAIGHDGEMFDVQAISKGGVRYDVKGVNQNGSVIDIKAIGEYGNYYGVKAFSSSGFFNDVKGIKLSDNKVEGTENGISFFSHVKAIKKASGTCKHAVWHLRAINPEGELIAIRAFDENGKAYPVEALRNGDQRHIIDVKAKLGDDLLPVKVLVSEERFKPVKAIMPDGRLLDVKAVTPDGRRLHVKGVNREGNIVHILAINETGGFHTIKAIDPDGQTNHVVGIKMKKVSLETTIAGQKVHAHVKALPY